ncbi:uncharacterized protein E0L32_008893 [Thyridium curvatum]|uniref:Methyltransferase type 11 domain-containing protein n=1 Tax=Thyridium curvatum TaxID=1093900 RepID=A0A507AYD1_9PEZI|nr:uncharacterized protein E0L32_008893 [Thyridium curvatum]TPX09871.1 hypothetical protein E0L32_008893 [Thyridium curvatum]
MNSNRKFFAQDDRFWETYLKGRPCAPDSFFDRIIDYHEAKGGYYDTVHDVGAGVGPYAQRLRSNFDHVIVSDIVPDNIKLARMRLKDSDGFSFRVASLQDADDIPPVSVDMVFATNVMHFAEPQKAAIDAFARQLRSGGTFAAALFGPARFKDPRLQDLWSRISHQGGRELLKIADDPDQTIRIMSRTQGAYNVAPLTSDLFEPGVRRINLNMRDGGIQGMLPPEEAHRDVEPNYTNPDDIEEHVDEAGWDFETDLAGLKEHFASFPFVSQFPDAFVDLYRELDQLVGSGRRVQGYFPAKIILATRR